MQGPQLLTDNGATAAAQRAGHQPRALEPWDAHRPSHRSRLLEDILFPPFPAVLSWDVRGGRGGGGQHSGARKGRAPEGPERGRGGGGGVIGEGRRTEGTGRRGIRQGTGRDRAAETAAGGTARGLTCAGPGPARLRQQQLGAGSLPGHGLTVRPSLRARCVRASVRRNLRGHRPSARG